MPTLSLTTKQTFAGLYILKRLDLDEKDGGGPIPVVTARNGPIEAVLDTLLMDGLLEIQKKKQTYALTAKGLEQLRTSIDEAEHYIEEFDHLEFDELVTELHRRRLNPLRVRYLWGWYQGEFDDVVLFQQQRGFEEIETEWESFIMDDAFYASLEAELSGDATQ